MNPLLILGPIGMMLVGMVSIMIWKLQRGVKLKYFLLGGLIWLISITPKFIMDLTITSTLSSWAKSMLGTLGFLTIIGLYVGLRTGLLECGFMYLIFSKSKLKNMLFKEAVAFGIGFGAFEAISISLSAMVQLIVFILNPSILELIPEERREFIEVQLNMPTWVVLAPIIERVFTLLIHIFTTLVIFVSVKWRRLSYLLGAIAYKSVVDAVIPYLHWIFKPTLSPIGAYKAEIWVVVMGLLALLGTRLTMSKLEEE